MVDSSETARAAYSEASIISPQLNDFRIIRIHNSHVNRTSNKTSAVIDRHIFILIGKDLHWIDLFSEQISLKLVATLADQTNEGDKQTIADVQVRKM